MASFPSETNPSAWADGRSAGTVCAPRPTATAMATSNEVFMTILLG
jgi:hypothetical protein